MPIRRTLALALAALTLSTSFATATTAVPDPLRCHDETTMYIGVLVDGECRGPALPARHHGYELGWDSSSFNGRDAGTTGHTARGGASLPLIRY